MYERSLELMSILSKFGGGRMDTFPERMFNQKVVFILSRIGIPDLDYPFNWYVRGPYSPELTFDLYESQGILDMLEHQQIVPSFNAGDAPALNTFPNLLRELKETDPDKDIEVKLEMIASIIYLAEQVAPWKDKQTAIREALPRLKEHFKDWDIDKYLSIASKYYRL